MAQNGCLYIERLDNGYLVRVTPPAPKENLYDNSPMQMPETSEGAVSSEEVAGVVAQWVETGSVEFSDFKSEREKELSDAMKHGQEPRVIPATTLLQDPQKVVYNGR
jgi:hypothetical protein